MINPGFIRYLDKLADEYGDGAEGDTMRRAAATIRALEGELSTLKLQNEGLQEEVKRVSAYNKQLEAARGWVSVEERLPEDGQRVLLTYTSGEAHVADSTGGTHP